ncbi:MAG: GGDEF domain-containing protein [Eubacterium sp.]|nr:GGDEF domain-containing protein [Eubacterium sp.]
METKNEDKVRQQALSILKNPKRFAYSVNALLLLIHLCFIPLFDVLEADMIYKYNFFSILVYLVCFIILWKAPTGVFIGTIFAEIFIFMILGTMSLGWDIGFHKYCYCFLVSIMFIDVFISSKETMTKKTYTLAFLVIAAYILLRLYTWKYPFMYDINNPYLIGVFSIINSILVFLFIFAFILVYAINAYQMQDEMKKRALNDQLTGLTNRRAMHELLDEKISKVGPEDNLAIAIFDIDFFKKVNDTYGHDAGDEVLKKFATKLVGVGTSMIGTESARWGGEEFLLVFFPLRKLSMGQFKAEIIDIVEKIRRSVSADQVDYKGQRIQITMTAGVAFYRYGDDEMKLFKEADELLYYGKENGRNQVVSEIPNK